MCQSGGVGKAGLRSGECRCSDLREVGGRVVANAMLREFDLAAPNSRDQCRLEILVDGLPLFGGAQLAVDRTLVSPLHCDGICHPRVANEYGAVLVAARRLKERTYPVLMGPRRRARLVVLVGEMGCRGSEEIGRFLSLLAKAKARSEPPILKRRAEQAWRMSGRDRGRYSRECWLSTLGVLHPGVPVMWYGLIRDLFPTAEGCMGGRSPNVTRLHWAKQPRWCKAVTVWWMEVGWVGSPPHIIAHTTRGAHAQVLSIFFPSHPGPVVGEMPSAARYAAVGMWQALTHVVRDAFFEEDEGIAEVREQHR